MKKMLFALLFNALLLPAIAQIGNFNPSVGSSIIAPGGSAITSTGCFIPLPTTTTGTFYFTYSATGSSIVSSVTLSATSSGSTVTTVGTSTPVYFNGSNIYYNISLNPNAAYCSSQVLTISLYRWNGNGYYLYCTKTQTVFCRDDSNDNLVQLNSGIYYVTNDNTIDRMYWNGSSWQYENINPIWGWGGIQVDGWLAVDNGDLSFDKIFFKGKDAKVYNLYKSGSDWYVGVLSNTATAVSGCIRARADGVFYIGTDSRIHHLYWNSGWQYEAIAPWTGWTVSAQIDLFLGTPLRRGQSLSLAAWPASNVYFRSNTNKIYNLTGSTGAWNLGQISPSTAIDCAGELINDNTGVYYKGTDNFIHRIFWNTSGWNYDAMPLNNLTTANTAGQLSKNVGENRVFYKGTDGMLYNMYASGSGWDVYPLGYNGNIVAGDVLANGNVYFIGNDNFVYSYWWGGSGWNLNALTYSIANAKGCSFSYRLAQQISSSSTDDKLRLYPVPASVSLTVELNTSEEMEVQLSVYNIMGQCVHNESVTVFGTLKKEINTQEFADGQYQLIIISQNGEKQNQKFSVLH
jgi:hypothetical protein